MGNIIRIAHIADSHFERASRWEDCVAIHEWIAGDIQDRDVDLLIHAGDVFHAKSTPEERTAVAIWLQMVADHCPVIVVRGNHDAPGDLEIFGRLRTKHPVIVQERVGIHCVQSRRGGPVTVGALAWPRKGEMLARMPKASDAEADAALVEAMRGLLRGMVQGRREGQPFVLLAHAMVRGSVTSVGQPLVGCEMELGLEDLALSNPSFVALGHIHARQDWEYNGAPIVYPGSPRRTAFGENEPKGYVIAEFDGAKLSGWGRIETPARPMLHAEWSFGGDMPNLTPTDAHGAEIRLRYVARSEDRLIARRQAEELRDRLLAIGAKVVKIEEVVETTVRARAPEVATCRTTSEKLQAFWRAKGSVPSEAERSRILRKLAELEAAEEMRAS